ncbi:hypothetical protein CR513_40828, partial [Mucuna pruriens]
MVFTLQSNVIILSLGVLLVLHLEDSFKNKGMPLNVTETRYSLVKGERIVRFVSITRLHSELSRVAAYKNVTLVLYCYADFLKKHLSLKPFLCSLSSASK